MRKSRAELSLDDFDRVSVWTSVEGSDAVEPSAHRDEIPDHVSGLWVRIHGKLADETPIVGMAMVECPPPRLHHHSLFVEGQWLELDFDGSESGPESLARRLNRSVGQTFPIWIRAEVKAECTGDVISQELDITGPTV